MSGAGLWDRVGSAVALFCALAGLCLFAAVTGCTREPDGGAHMADVIRWAADGCTTDTDCEAWGAWAAAVCADAEACGLAWHAGALPATDEHGMPWRVTP